MICGDTLVFAFQSAITSDPSETHFTFSFFFFPDAHFLQVTSQLHRNPTAAVFEEPGRSANSSLCDNEFAGADLSRRDQKFPVFPPGDPECAPAVSG